MSVDVRGDSDLWQVMSRGDMSALGEIFDRHSNRVYKFLVRFLASPHDAEDALSDVFVEVWRSRRSFALEGDSALPILFAIARRVGQKHHRSATRRPQPVLSEDFRDHQLVDPDIAQSIVDEQEKTARAIWLRTQVEQLRTPYRNVFELSIYAELSHDEISASLRIPVGTVKSRLSRAKKIISDASGGDLCSATRRGDSRGY